MEAIYDNNNFICVCEFLPNHLYFVTVQNINNGGSCDAIIPHTEDIHFFNTDNELVYHNFYGDFGPLNITCLYKFCKKLTNKLATYAGDTFYEKFTNSRFGRKDVAEKLQEKFVKKKIIVYYTSTNNEKRANSAFLIAAFAVLYLGFSPRLAYKALQPTKLRYRPFQDASIGLSPYKISMKNCLDALHKASIFGFFNFNDFNAAECAHYENIEHGDLNWIVPQKFIAFPGPVEEKNDYHHPNFYIEYFLCNNVTDVIRLNQRAYDPKCFTMFNLKHHDLYMQDGTDPPDYILKAFLNVAETASGAIAVHCKAGLGRTGSLIGAYLLKHYRMTAKEAIAWVRICRPGSVIGHQQTWLENHEEMLWHEGNEWRYKMYGKKEIVPFLQYGIYSYETPKKEFPGLRELLNHLTKRSRYRFVVKNRSKKSKTRLHHMIKNLLESGKSTKIDTTESQSENVGENPTVQENSNWTAQTFGGSKEAIQEESKNVHYLKAPPVIQEPERKQPFNYEYPQLEYKKPLPPKRYPDPYYPPLNFPKHVEYFNTNYSGISTPYEEKMPAMYSNPNSFYSNSSNAEHGVHSLGQKNTNGPVNARVNPPNETLNFPKDTRSPEMFSIYSDPTQLRKFEKKSDHQSKSIDKNWKQNNTSAAKFYPPSDTPKESYQTVVPMLGKPQEEVCAFDTRVDTLTQYSRFNKSYLTKGYLDQSSMNPLNDTDYYHNSKMKGYTCSKPPDRSSHGFLLSPEDLQSWVETFDEKVNDTLADNKFAMKRSSVM